MKGLKGWWAQLIDDCQYFSNKAREFSFKKLREEVVTDSHTKVKTRQREFYDTSDDSDIKPTPLMLPSSGGANCPKGLPGSEFTDTIF